jgi:hypothetical protein
VLLASEDARECRADEFEHVLRRDPSVVVASAPAENGLSGNRLVDPGLDEGAIDMHDDHLSESQPGLNRRADDGCELNDLG